MPNSASTSAATGPLKLTADLIHEADLVVVVGTQAHLDPPPESTPAGTWDIDEPSLRGIDGIERMRLIRDEIADDVRALNGELRHSNSAKLVRPTGTSDTALQALFPTITRAGNRIVGHSHIHPLPAYRPPMKIGVQGLATKAPSKARHISG